MKEKMIKRKLLSFLLTLALVLGLVPWMSLTAYAATEYEIWVGGTRVTSDNAVDIPVADGMGSRTGKASYDANSATLTLNAYQYEGTCSLTYSGYFGDETESAIICCRKANQLEKIIIKGNVSLKQTGTTKNPCGIYLPMGWITIEGEGDNPTLTIESAIPTDNSKGRGIHADQTLTISNCTVNAKSNGAASGKDSAGIYCTGAEIIIKNSTVTATGGSCANGESMGIGGVDTYNDNPVELKITNSTVKGTGGTCSGGSSFGAKCNVTIDDKSNVAFYGGSKAIAGTVINGVPGTGWTDESKSGSGTELTVNTEATTYNDYKAIEFLPPPPQIGSGAGTVNDPYIITTADEMAIFRDIVMGENRQIKNQAACAKLGNDITLTDIWTPIGTAYDSTAYKGTFNGEGYTIKGLSISSGNYGGIFGAVFNGTVKNLIVEGVYCKIKM